MSRERNRPQQRPPDESFDDESILQDYLARLMTMQDQRQEEWLEEADLEAAAQDLGLSADDLQRLAATTEAHRTRGRSFAGRGLWAEAIEAHRQAAALSPFDANAAHELALAYLGRWRVDASEADRAEAERYAHRTLQLDPEHSGAYEVLQELKRRPVRTGGPSRAEVNLSRTLVIGAIVGLVLLALLALILI